MRRTKRFFVEELHKNDNTLSKTKLFKMKLEELENMFNSLKLTPSNSENYCRAEFDDISDDEKPEPEQQDVEQPVAEPKVSTPELEPIVSKPEPEPKAKFNRKELKKLFLDPFNRDVKELIKDLDDGNINEELAINEFNILYEEYLQSVEEYTADMDMTQRDIQYIDNFFALQEKRL